MGAEAYLVAASSVPYKAGVRMLRHSGGTCWTN